MPLRSVFSPSYRLRVARMALCWLLVALAVFGVATAARTPSSHDGASRSTVEFASVVFGGNARPRLSE